MKTIPALRALFALTLLLTAAAVMPAQPRSDADQDSTATCKLSAPGQPATLTLDLPWADVRITGVDGDTVTVSSSLNQKSTKPARPGALRRLDDEVSFELVEKDNVVTLRLAGDNPWAGHNAEFKITVPRTMSLNLKTNAGGDLVVSGVEGDIEINNMNGEVKLDGLVGSTVINTMNGEVRAVYAKAPTKPVSITSMNGEVDLRLPAAAKANIRLRTHNGSILTDFGEDVLKTKSEGAKGSGYSYSYGAGAGAEAREIAQAAAEVARTAVAVSREVAREVQREIARAVKESNGELAPVAPITPLAPKAPRAPRAPIPPITGGKLVSGTLNGGGVDIAVSTMNGEITLRQVK
jgi:hypothetical protein